MPRRYAARVLDISSSTDALLFWTGSAVTSIERVLLDDLSFSPWSRSEPDAPDSRVRQQDAALALLALRNVLRAAEWCARDLDQAGDNVSALVTGFKSMVSDLVNSRDALEHFDEYAVGRGRLQSASPGSYHFELVLEGGEPVVNVGRFLIHMRAARDACRWLTINLLARIEQQNPHKAEAEALLDKILAEVPDE